MPTRKKRPTPPPAGPIAYGAHLLPDFTAEKVLESSRLAAFLQGLSGPDLLRVVSSSIHEFVHRWPHRTVNELVVAAEQAINEGHQAGLP